jgi:hypothetical protein
MSLTCLVWDCASHAVPGAEEWCPFAKIATKLWIETWRCLRQVGTEDRCGAGAGRSQAPAGEPQAGRGSESAVAVTAPSWARAGKQD